MIQENVTLKNYSNYKIGGPARYFLKVDNVDELRDELRRFRKMIPNVKMLILGAGTNILFDDRGFSGLVIYLQNSYIKKIENNIIEVGASTLMNELLDYTIDNSLSGLEWAGGLPGTFGGAIFGNAGAFSGEIKDSIINVTSINLDTFDITTRSCKDCQFSYRNSIFKKNLFQKEIIISACIKLTTVNQIRIKESILEKIEYRKFKQPLEFPNIGSTFKNVDVKKILATVLKKYHDKIKTDPFPVIPAAVFLSEAGLKGRTIGGAQISEKHPNFIVNINNAKADDVKQLIQIALNEVKKKFNIELEKEIIELEF